MNPDDIGSLEWRRDHLAQWLSRHKKAQCIVPFVQSNLEVTEWQIQALSNIPQEAGGMPDPGFAKKFKEENRYIESTVPLMPDYDPEVAVGSTAVTALSSSDVFTYVVRIGDIGTPAAEKYAEAYTAGYLELQEKQSRQTRTRELIVQLRNPQTLGRFDRALEGVTAWKAGTGGRTAAANEIRNLMYGIKGDLFSAARKWPDENMTWRRLAERLARGGRSSPNIEQVVQLEAKHNELVGLLSGPVKDREGESLVDLKHLWTRVLDHAYALLTLVDVHKT